MRRVVYLASQSHHRSAALSDNEIIATMYERPPALIREDLGGKPPPPVIASTHAVTLIRATVGARRQASGIRDAERHGAINAGAPALGVSAANAPSWQDWRTMRFCSTKPSAGRFHDGSGHGLVPDDIQAARGGDETARGAFRRVPVSP